MKKQFPFRQAIMSGLNRVAEDAGRCVSVSVGEAAETVAQRALDYLRQEFQVAYLEVDFCETPEDMIALLDRLSYAIGVKEKKQ